MTEIPVWPAGRAPDAGEQQHDMAGIFAGLQVSLNRLSDNLDQARRIRAEEASHVWAITIDPIPVPLTAGFGVLDLPQLLSPGLGEHWDVHTISATGFTAGTVTGWINLQGQALTAASILSGAVRFSASSAGFANYGKNQCHLRPQDKLVFVAAGITVPAGGQVLVSLDATRVADQYWGRYLI
jgi:hypothetical protein